MQSKIDTPIRLVDPKPPVSRRIERVYYTTKIPDYQESQDFQYKLQQPIQLNRISSRASEQRSPKTPAFKAFRESRDHFLNDHPERKALSSKQRLHSLNKTINQKPPQELQYYIPSKPLTTFNVQTQSTQARTYAKLNQFTNESINTLQLIYKQELPFVMNTPNLKISTTPQSYNALSNLRTVQREPELRRVQSIIKTGNKREESVQRLHVPLVPTKFYKKAHQYLQQKSRNQYYSISPEVRQIKPTYVPVEELKPHVPFRLPHNLVTDASLRQHSLTRIPASPQSNLDLPNVSLRTPIYDRVLQSPIITKKSAQNAASLPAARAGDKPERQLDFGQFVNILNINKNDSQVVGEAYKLWSQATQQYFCPETKLFQQINKYAEKGHWLAKEFILNFNMSHKGSALREVLT